VQATAERAPLSRDQARRAARPRRRRNRGHRPRAAGRGRGGPCYLSSAGWTSSPGSWSPEFSPARSNRA
jgi:hypothetical protein